MTKRTLSILFSFLLMTAIGFADDSKENLSKAIIDGSEDGWKPLGEDDFRNINCKPDTFKWKDGTIYCTGDPVGVISSKKSYTNFELVVDWRHMKYAGNSGIFIWASEESFDRLKAGEGNLPDGIEAAAVVDYVAEALDECVEVSARRGVHVAAGGAHGRRGVDA